MPLYVDAVRRSEIGQPGGVAMLDASGQVPSTQLPAGSGGGTYTPIIVTDGLPSEAVGNTLDVAIDPVTGAFYRKNP